MPLCNRLIDGLVWAERPGSRTRAGILNAPIHQRLGLGFYMGLLGLFQGLFLVGLLTDVFKHVHGYLHAPAPRCMGGFSAAPSEAQRKPSVAIYTKVCPDTKRGCSQICSQLQRLAFNLPVIPMDYRHC